MKKIQKYEKICFENGPYATQFKGQLQPLKAIIRPGRAKFKETP